LCNRIGTILSNFGVFNIRNSLMPFETKLYRKDTMSSTHNGASHNNRDEWEKVHQVKIFCALF
jgi:hypothetical protein